MFFQVINQLITTGTDLSINIRRVTDNLAVSVIPRRTGVKDEAGGHIVPLVLNGTPEELDAAFLQAIRTPVQKAQGILINMETFERQTEKAVSQSKAAKSAGEKESKEAREKREKMEKLLKKANEATVGKRYSEALTWLRQAKVLAVPEKQKEIDTKMAEVQKKASEGSLFGLEPAIPEPQQIPQQVPQAPVNATRYQQGEQIQMFAPGQQPSQGVHPVQTQPGHPSAHSGQYARTMAPAYPETNGAPADYPSGGQAPAQPLPQPQAVRFHQPVQMPQPQVDDTRWRQAASPQPQAVPVQTTGNNGNREHRSQPQDAGIPYDFDRYDKCDRELLKEDPYAEYLDFPEECRMKDEAQIDMVYC